MSAQEDKLTIIDTRKQEMDNSLEEMKYELEKAMRRECKLDFRLAEVCPAQFFSNFFFILFLRVVNMLTSVSFLNFLVSPN